MIIEPRMRGFICLTAHPDGCEQNIKNQIEYVKSKGAINGAKKVLVIGASTGLLASRISSAFGSDAATIGVFFENRLQQEEQLHQVGTILLLLKRSTKAGLYAKSVNGDAFSEIKKTLALIKADLGQVDLIIYSLLRACIRLQVFCIALC
jgi:enoyl-[acyl-carrier protein] reductase/trans-2-enoyl-CoA reductase (NAD+)